MAHEVGWPSISNGIQIIGLFIVAWQLWIANKQRETDSLARLLDTNRQLISLGFSQPELLKILRDEKNVNPALEHYFLQLWLNHFSMAHAYIKHSFFRRERRENLTRGITGFMKMANMQHHWENEGQYYPPSFQKFVNKIIKEVEPDLSQKESYPKE